MELHITANTALLGLIILFAILTKGLSFSFCVSSSNPKAVRAMTSIVKFPKFLKHGRNITFNLSIDSGMQIMYCGTLQ